MGWKAGWDGREGLTKTYKKLVGSVKTPSACKLFLQAFRVSYYPEPGLESLKPNHSTTPAAIMYLDLPRLVIFKFVEPVSTVGPYWFFRLVWFIDTREAQGATQAQ